MSTCRSCGAAVQWGRIEPSGKAVPLDPEPQPDGNLIVVRATYDARGNLAPVVRVVKGDPGPDVQRFVSHFVTCPQAELWRAP